MIVPNGICRYAPIRPGAGWQAALRWLSGRERLQLAALTASSRKATWVAGRRLAKQVVLQHLARRPHAALPLDPQEIEIDSGPVRGRRNRPRVLLGGVPLPESLSLAHTTRGVLVALAPRPAAAVGVDLVEPVPLGRGFQRLWLSERERRALQRGPSQIRLATVWAVKEAVFKACHQGEKFVPARIEVIRRGPGRYACSYHGRSLENQPLIHVWRVDGQIAALVMVSSECTEEPLLFCRATAMPNTSDGLCS